MYTFIVILILIVSILLALVVLVQNSKGGGLAANFAAPTQVMGVRQTADFLEKATWWLAIILVVLSLAATVSIPRAHTANTLETEVTTTGNDVSPVQNNNTAAPVAEQQ
ncbi:MAG: preprotein translocase subunit SecG [Bacteroidales bacterium]|nr:preprotein translocase subunit SecG [Bacteroidales bacterium]